MHLTVINLKPFKRRICLVIILLCIVGAAMGPVIETIGYMDEKDEMTIVLKNILNDRSKIFISGDYKLLDNYFDTSQKLGKWAWEHEVKRIKYLRDWSKQRNISFTSIESDVLIKKLTKVNDERIKLTFDEFYKFDYVYKDDVEPVINSFGVRLTHVCELMKVDDGWKFYKDWYLDCFNDAIMGYNAIIKKEDISADYAYEAVPAASVKTTYNRENAVEYADKYCAVPWANGGTYGYNKKYRNYNGIGGDCTNYVSQCLGDKEAGNLRFDGIWYCHYGKSNGSSAGSAAWLNAQKFKNYLIYSGKGKQVAKGNYKKLTTASEANNYIAPISLLTLGDIISFEEKGTVVHNAIITDFDSHGYPLVNTHTVDRYHVPWDLGWSDKDIQFFLIHIR